MDRPGVETPIRDPANDPLERHGFRALLLDAAPAEDQAVEGASPSSCTIERVDRDALATDERGLSQLSGCWRSPITRCGPPICGGCSTPRNLSVFAMRHGDHVVGTALVARGAGSTPRCATPSTRAAADPTPTCCRRRSPPTSACASR